MFRAIKLYFTDRNYYYQRKRYMKLQKEYRKKLIKQSKEFCPWSGYYMHKMIVTMLEFYYKTYEAKDCCWSESAWNGKVAASLKDALAAAEKLDTYEELEVDELIALAESEYGFLKYLEKWEKKTGLKTDKADKKYLLYGVAEAYFEKKYTTALYNTIGKHIWEWMD